MFFSPAGIDLKPAAHFDHRHPLELGPFTITPYLNDHNGFDTYSLLIEADGRRLFYSADFQGHGPKWKIFQEMLRKPPEDVDVMLMEGTNVREDIGGHSERTEDELKGELEAEIRATKGLTLITYSSQSIDRLCTIHGATKRAGKTLVLDLLTATMAQATKRESIPVPGWDHLLVYVPEHQRRLVARSEEFDRLPDKKARIFREEMARRRGELVLTFRVSMARELEGSGCIEGATAIWSMWPGHLDRPSTKSYRDFLAKHGIPLKTHHASGHAYVKDLQKLAKAVAPKRLVPIHSFSPDLFKALFDNVEQRADGEWWEV